jgi:hypothetical protein
MGGVEVVLGKWVVRMGGGRNWPKNVFNGWTFIIDDELSGSKII